MFHSILLQEEYDERGVPIAASYHEPNKQQLSQTLTEEMVKPRKIIKFWNLFDSTRKEGKIISRNVID